ncbi:MAG: alpha/beta hydrolase [Candidatus Hermodarchaeota archaeon]
MGIFTKRRILAGGVICVIIVSVILGGFILWVLDYSPAMEEAKAALVSDDYVEVQTDNWFAFTPKNASYSLGFIFYPGGKVDPVAYAPLAKNIAREGFLVVIVPMTFNLAVLSPNRASEVINNYLTISTWVIGGHSLGGSMAADFASRNLNSITGLILLASYPPDTVDLSDSEIDAISISATLDGVLNTQNFNSTKENLPSNTTYVSIEGGNHAQFGWYGDQAGDNEASISREAQQEKTVDAILTFLNSF